MSEEKKKGVKATASFSAEMKAAPKPAPAPVKMGRPSKYKPEF
jgi:hypothetical protein